MTKQNIDWDALGFGVYPTRSMWQSTCPINGDWADGSLIPYGNIEISPAAGVLNYGQGVFEGMKAYHSAKDRIVLFRPNMNGKRIANSSHRLCMPELKTDYFLNAVEQVVSDNSDFIPPYGKGGLYIRPIVWGTSPTLGVAPASKYTFMIYTAPVGSYFKGNIKPLNLIASDSYHRAAPKGIGNVKAIGNYSASLRPVIEAKTQGFDEVLYLKADDERLVEEVGSANIFMRKGNQLVTPKLSGSILPGVTRDSIIQLAQDRLGLQVEEGELLLSDVFSADEIFCTGTAVVVTPVGQVTFRGKTHTINDGNMGEAATELRKTLLGIQREDIDDPYGWVHEVKTT
ncbi:MAG: branched-chain amino acid aminotransferase [Candidatus Marinimicrobia bacterium]|jgi:branched-chain amino acid aminotransferase|nr:branched-chain amino acid aminotransferase [Candidatus Neomarinimicrobiota bacterium]MBT4737140.1 branched-chain amino acid aminotransferase [Candidatus Neomarinimicrobiota bacterium]MBT5777649.1 branched-chain amino acid aminotransferase [Candidatus Neomarinimicrobiota bacterium]MBT5996455.1 branched-chain amino acid aminotransferase [Candidatus Neomarinimicrobiota bacterium]MBT6389832.1 branched-chain amino acid aminotransferase [Candidatus Neomarinimicrobiota bacterium]